MEMQTSNKGPDLPQQQDPLGASQGDPQRPGGPLPPSIGGMISRTLAHWYIAVLVLVVGAALTVLVVRTRKPAYRSETVIFYREGVKAAYLGPDGPDPLRTLSARLKETLLARSNLEKVVEEFNLFPDVVEKRGTVDAVERLRSKVVFRARAPDTFAISYEGGTREEAQEVTQRLAELLVEENTRVRQTQAKITSEFLDAEQKRAEEELNKADKDLAGFLADHPEFAAEQIQPGGTQAGSAVRAEQRRASEGDPTLDALERQVPRLKGRLSTPAPGAAPGAAPGTAAPPPALLQAKQQADQELASAQRDLTEKQARFTEAHPDVRAAMARANAAAAGVARAEQALATAAAPPPAAPEVQGPSAEPPKRDPEKARVQAQLAQIQKEINQRKKAKETAQQQAPDASETAKQIVSLETDWSRLAREQARARQRLTDLEAKVFRADIAASSEEGGYSAQIVVLDPAFKPSAPSTPSRSLVALAGLVASLIAGIGLAAARGILLDDRVYDAEDIERLGLAPVLAIVSHAPRRHRWPRG